MDLRRNAAITPEDRALALGLRKEGLTYREISERTAGRLSRQQVITINRTGTTPEKARVRAAQAARRARCQAGPDRYRHEAHWAKVRAKSVGTPWAPGQTDHVALMLSKPVKRCAICGVLETPEGKKLVIDHDHGSGKIRGLLCRLCNVFIGQAKESVVILQNAIQYLQEQR